MHVEEGGFVQETPEHGSELQFPLEQPYGQFWELVVSVTHPRELLQLSVEQTLVLPSHEHPEPLPQNWLCEK